MPQVYLSLGSNMGDRERSLDNAIEQIDRLAGHVIALSDRIETEPWGFDSSNLFLNQVVEIQTGLPPLELLSVTQQIERNLGRTEKSVQGIYKDRIIDIDILIYEGVAMDTPELTIPHKHLAERPFFLSLLRQLTETNCPDRN